ncbi:heparinase II/III family protein [Maridesulfovibrio frigidus]|uniref:heparinase II/III family protein n=1 Tax=Maridesulfovibrio frigidus TaxID=340956 RepID=UPI0004E2515F|nr:alginate lyase family protein [Maridesulfovibrio frigidus]
MTVNKIIWLLNRLKAMRPNEVLWRFRTEARTFAERFGFMTAKVVARADLRSASSCWLPMDGLDSAQELIVFSADQILNEGMNLFALENKVPCVTPEWNRDPSTGKLSPLSFGKRLKFKDQSLCGDVKYLWELSRFLQIVPLARAWHVSGDEKYLRSIRSMVESWLDECPYMRGVHWSSSLEIGIRLINWSLAWQYLGGINSPIFDGKDGELFRTRWLDSIYQHLHFINGFYSKGSSANNHLIGEAAGVFTSCKTWPFWEECERWEATALNILEAESSAQVFDDGVGREQTTSYQQFVIDFLLLAYLADKNKFTQKYFKTIEKMIGFISSLMDVSGNVPMIGDADDGIVTGLGMYDEFQPFKSLLATGGILFSRDDFLQKSGGYDLKSMSLMGRVREPSAQGETKSPLNCREYRGGGYFILGDSFGTESELFIVADAGPLGYGALAAHGHADALSIYMSLAGREFLVDPGTYVYSGNDKWRDYFRGTSAHNTVRIDGLNQSEIGGSFLWKNHAEVEGTVHFDRDVETFRGKHNGYERLSDPVIHERTVSLDKLGQRIVVQDHLRCKSAHSVEQLWHFSEDCNVVFDGPHKVIVTNSGVSMEMHFGEAVTLQMLKGESTPPFGYVSRKFGVKVPSVTIIADVYIEGDSCLIAEIVYGRI